jgi:hypothetical protein
MDEEILEVCRRNPAKLVSGTTALAALQVGSDLYVANSGKPSAAIRQTCDLLFSALWASWHAWLS